MNGYLLMIGNICNSHGSCNNILRYVRKKCFIVWMHLLVIMLKAIQRMLCFQFKCIGSLSIWVKKL